MLGYSAELLDFWKVTALDKDILSKRLIRDRLVDDEFDLPGIAIFISLKR